MIDASISALLVRLGDRKKVGSRKQQNTKRGEAKMRFMMIVKASKESEAGQMPSEEMLNTMGKYNEELVKAGVWVDGTGLQPSSKGARLKYSAGKRTVIDGPFAETKELIAGYWIIKVNSREEAINWAKRVPGTHGPDKEDEIELRQLFELEDFAPSPAVERARALEAKMGKSE
jgi:hypothetical protein